MDRLRRVTTPMLAGLCFAIVLFALSAGAEAYPSFRIRQIASSQDGGAQIIELEEVNGNNGQDAFAVLRFKVVNRAGIAKVFEFPSDLANAATAYRHVVIATQDLPGFHAPFYPDFVLPKQFLPTDGGTLYFEVCSECINPLRLDELSFDAIPTDGNMLQRNGKIGPGTIRNYSDQLLDCCVAATDPWGAPFGIDFSAIGIVEYFNQDLDHYFMSGSQPDLDALDSERIRGWDRRGTFPASSRPASYDSALDDRLPIHTVPVCRYYIPTGSHFFSASADECRMTAQQHPEYVLETNAAFHIVLPDLTTGECPPPVWFSNLVLVFDPVYRLWNNRPDTNHRFTDSTFQRFELIKQGWVPEGYGPLGVAMCSQSWRSP